MKVMVVGGGGREHAIVKKLLENKSISRLFVLPSNGGINKIAEGVDIKATDLDAIVRFGQDNAVDYAVVACDDPLVMGLVDRLNEKGIPCFGPAQKAAMIEGSKVFAKSFMTKYSIPTPKYRAFDSPDDALRYLKNVDYPAVIKADGVAAGKGVTIVSDFNQAKTTITAVMRDKMFGASGDKVVVEEYLTGAEFTLMTFTDGKTIVPMVSSTDHKRAFDNDLGLNTGGMGTIAPSPVYTHEVEKDTLENIVYPTLRALQAEGIVFKGCLYFGLMATDKGVRVIEYNCRFGDPETQVVLPMLKTDLLTVMRAVTDGTLDKIKVEFEKKCACCVIMASKGYPMKFQKGYEIQIPPDIEPYVYYAGVKAQEGKLVTDGGRVLGVTAVENDLKQAIETAYKRVDKIKFENAFYRKDIGKKAVRGVTNGF